MRLNNIKSQVSTITKQLTQTVRWWCGGGAVGTARVDKAVGGWRLPVAGWRLAVGGWRLAGVDTQGTAVGRGT